jgi:hypothetical protein
MKTLSFAYTSWNAKRYLGSLGFFGHIAIAIFILCAVFVAFVLAPLQDRVIAVQRRISALHTQSTLTMDVEQDMLTPAQQLKRFRDFFPKQATASHWISKLYDAAAQQNLSLDQGDYQFTQDKDSNLIRCEILLPIKGDYVQIRKFIARVLTDVPSLALDTIVFNRQKITDTTVDAQLGFTLYLGDE